ncbi:MAG TPA: hypothetical protein VGB92_20880 [Longimicrobium sp.]|jgi:nucleoside phosphorylase
MIVDTPGIENFSRKELARLLLDAGTEEADVQPQPSMAALLADPVGPPKLKIPFPDGLAPRPQPIDPAPNAEAALPQADVLVVTWTVAELNALADVLTPGVQRDAWYRYRRGFDERYAGQIREGAPAAKSRRLGSYFPTRIGGQSVVCFKSELHLNQDGIATGDGTATLPVKDLFRQLIEEVRPRLVITTGTAGATFLEHSLGDAVVTRGAKFRLSDEFKNEAFKSAEFRCDWWEIPTRHFDTANELMRRFHDRLVEPAFAPPTKRFDFAGPPLPAWPNEARIRLEGTEGMPPFHPILTTDFFEFGTSANGMEHEGAAVEMGDAVLGMVCDELDDPPAWVVVRNCSDPQINADLPTTPRALNMQTHWAVWYYEKYGYWTSVNSAIACWAIIAGLDGDGGGQ